MVYLAHIRTTFALSNDTYGSARMHRNLIDDGHRVSRHRTARPMRENGLMAPQKRRFKQTTANEHAWPQLGETIPRVVSRSSQPPNLLAQDFEATVPDRK